MRPRQAQISLTTEPDRLDAAIDQVAARMVQVREDEDLAFRIAGTLPKRSLRYGWLIPQFAVVAAFVVAVVVWTTRAAAPPALLPSADVAVLVGMPNAVAAIAPGTVAPGTAVRTMPLESAFARNISGELRRDRLLEPLELLRSDGSDFDRSLAPIEALSALVMSDMDPEPLSGSPALVLAPIAITELPLTAESFSPS